MQKTSNKWKNDCCTLFHLSNISHATKLAAGCGMHCYLPPTKEQVHVFAHVHLSVCLSVSKITQKCIRDLDEMLRVDTCRDTDEPINF